MNDNKAINDPGFELTASVQTSLKNDNSDVNFSFYTYNDVPVPRVSQILNKVINKPYLLYWAANVGKKNMYISKKKATTIGTKVHSMIENYIKGDTKAPEFFNMYQDDIHTSLNCFDNFKSWYNNLINNGYSFKVLATELPVVCPYYGGTVDCIAEINGAVYIIDWKTSKQISLEYYIQTCAYMWVINNGYCPEINHVDGIGIVRVLKDGRGYEDSFLTYQNEVHAKYIDDYIRAFGSLLQSYYNLTHIEQFKHCYSINDILED